MVAFSPPNRRRPPSWSPGPLRRLLRRPLVYWAVVLAGASWAALLVASSVPEAVPAPVMAWRTVHDIDAGDPVAGHVERTEIPGRLEPSAMTVDLAPDAVAARPLGTNVILRAGDLTDATTLGPDEAALAVPSGPGTPIVAAGTAVMLIIDADPFTGTTATTVPGRVVALQSDHTLVAFAHHDLAAAAAALRSGTATLAVTAG